jgi:hypothetical protein
MDGLLFLKIMGDFTKLRNQIERLKKATAEEQERVILSIIKGEEQSLLNLVRLQLFQGIDADGNQLMPYQSEEYAKKKGRKIPDLYLTGSFHGRMFINTTKFPIIYWSSDSKTLKLVDKYGNILNLTEENKEGAAEEILKEQISLYYAGLFQI